MKIGDEKPLATIVRTTRKRRALSQSDLGELARVSNKTIQRMEAGHAIAGSSRRAILAALEIDLNDAQTADLDPQGVAPGPWVAVEEAGSLWRSLAAAGSVDVELDRDGWRQARRNRPWYRQDIVLATQDPVDLILGIVDGAASSTDLPPGRAAKQQDLLAEAMRAAGAMSWALATRVERSGRLHLYIGSPSVVAQRVAAGSATS